MNMQYPPACGGGRVAGSESMVPYPPAIMFDFMLKASHNWVVDHFRLLLTLLCRLYVHVVSLIEEDVQ